MKGMKVLFLASGVVGLLFLLVNALFFFQKQDKNHLLFEIKPHKPIFGLQKLGAIEILPLANEMFIKFQGNVNKFNKTDTIFLIHIKKEEEISKITEKLLSQKLMVNLMSEKKKKVYPYLKELMKKYPILWNSNLKLNILFGKENPSLQIMIDFMFKFTQEKNIVHFTSFEKIKPVELNSSSTTPDYSIFKRLSL
jgi:hypothetical protein